MVDSSQVMFSDQLSNGIDLGGSWQLITFGPAFTADSGTVQSSSAGLRVCSPGTNPSTGEPAMKPAQDLGNHLKWVAQRSETSTAGFQGRDVPADGVLSNDAIHPIYERILRSEPFASALAFTSSTSAAPLTGKN